MGFDRKIISRYYPGAEELMYEPMLIHSSTNEQLQTIANSGDYFGQIKKDGALYMFVKGSEGQCYLFGRTISKKTNLLTEKLNNVPHIYQALDCLPNNTVILGEIYYPNGSSKNVTEIMGCLPQKAIERQQGAKGLIHYYIYDILVYDNINFITAQTDNLTRYLILKKLYYSYNLDKFEDFIELASIWTDNLYARIGQTLAAGEEGMVLKNKTGIYEPGKRPMSNYKAKKVDFIDAFIIDFQSPTKYYYGKDLENWEYWIDDKENKLSIGCHINDGIEAFPVTKAYWYGWINSRIVLGVYKDNENQQIQQIGIIHSGISDQMKEDMSNNPDKYLMKVVKIQCMEKDCESYTIRHGFFLEMHPGKNTKDCLLSAVF